MDRSSLNFLYGANVKTVTEASLRASQVASSVSALVRNKSAMFGVLMRLWAWYSGETSAITSESGLAINDSLMSKPLEASEIAQLVNLHSNGLMSRKTVLDELQRGGVIDPDLVVEDEMERIEEDRQEKIEQQIEDAEVKLDLEVERTEKMQEIAPKPEAAVPGKEKAPGEEKVPGKRKPKTEQQKTEQAAKVAK